MAYSGLRELTTWSKRVFWAVPPCTVKFASIFANHTSGSAGQNGGSFMLTAARGAAGAVAAKSVAGVSMEPVAIARSHVAVTNVE